MFCTYCGQRTEESHKLCCKSPCEGFPCKNDAVCVPEYETNSYPCDCKTGFTGIHCAQECLGNKTCSQIKICHPHATNGSYLIDPDGIGGVTSFQVECDMTSMSEVGVTVISHDSEDKTLVDGYGAPGSYSRDIHYTGASLSQLASLIEQSAHCEQFIKYDCFYAALLNDGQPSYGWWVSRDGADMFYWGGVTSGDYKCACGLNNTCAHPDLNCNCDMRDQVWRVDSGLLTNKSDIPVSQLRFGDTGIDTDKGEHTLGKLKCYGIVDS